jgi:protein-tyrosine-phosphatase
MTKEEPSMKVVSSKAPLNVLFLCTGNSARSIMAECVLNRLGAGRIKAFSAGSQPAGQVNPLALQLLRQAHFDVSQLRSKRRSTRSVSHKPPHRDSRHNHRPIAPTAG